MVDEANSRVVAKVRVSLPDGRQEVWMVPLRLANDGPYYQGMVYLPDGAAIIERSHELRPLTSGQEIRIDRSELFTEPIPTLAPGS